MQKAHSCCVRETPGPGAAETVAVDGDADQSGVQTLFIEEVQRVHQSHFIVPGKEGLIVWH